LLNLSSRKKRNLKKRPKQSNLKTKGLRRQG